MRGEWSRYYAYPELHDLEVLHARFISHRFARHAHEYFVIGYVEQVARQVTGKRQRSLLKGAVLRDRAPSDMLRRLYREVAAQVSRIFANRNQLDGWLRQLDVLPRAA